MIKKINIITMLATLLISSYAKSQSNEIKITYSNAVEGYFVTASWKPIKVSYKHVVGPVIIEFKNIKDTTVFYITNNNFSILKDKLPFTYSKDSLEIEKLNKDAITLNYDESNLYTNENFGTTNEPFFFQDLDFDNIKELLIAEVNNGQRGVASFETYKIEYGEIEPELNGITKNEPFKSLDEMSKLDIKNKKIIIYNSDGICASGYEIYKLQLSNNNYEPNKYVLELIIQEQRDEKLNKCYELKYKSINKSKKLISKKEIK